MGTAFISWGWALHKGRFPQINCLARYHLHAGGATLSFDFLHNERDGSSRPTEKALLDAAHRNRFAGGSKPSAGRGCPAVFLNQGGRLCGSAIIGEKSVDRAPR